MPYVTEANYERLLLKPRGPITTHIDKACDTIKDIQMVSIKPKTYTDVKFCICENCLGVLEDLNSLCDGIDKINLKSTKDKSKIKSEDEDENQFVYLSRSGLNSFKASLDFKYHVQPDCHGLRKARVCLYRMEKITAVESEKSDLCLQCEQGHVNEIHAKLPIFDAFNS